MQFPQIRLQSNFARIEMSTTTAKQEIQQPKAELSIEQPQADLQIETTPGKLTIDQTQARADMDLKSIARRIEEFAQRGYQDWLEGLARVSQQGDRLMKIENGSHVIADLAQENSENPIYDFNIGWIPSHFSVKTNYVPAKVNIQITPKKPVISSHTNKPIIDFTPGKVNVSLSQKQSLSIDFVNLKHVGINYEQEI